MPRVMLGKTSLNVSVMGLGAGGASKLGMGTGKTRAESLALVRRALELGINLIDSAESYGTEELIGESIRGMPRDSIVISTKKSAWKDGGEVLRDEVEPALDASLKRLGVGHLDIYLLHAIAPSSYGHILSEVVPELQRIKKSGKVRFIGATEAFEQDPGHKMLSRALADGWADVVMTGFNILNQSAREAVLAPAMSNGVGTLAMFAVRKAFSNPKRLSEILTRLKVDGRLGPGFDEGTEPLSFLTAQGVADSLPDAAYRFCRYEPGMNSVLVGTGDISHLEGNARSLSRPPLPPDTLARLYSVFRHVDNVTGG